MTELIRIQKNDSGSEFLSARELYLFLGYDRSQWKRWYSKNIIQNEYAIEGIDYAGFDIVSNGNNTMEFSLTIEFAKKVSMLAKTEKGEQIRQYFIAREKQAKQLERQIKLPKTFSEALQLAADQAKQLELQAPKVDNYDKFIDSKSLQGFKEVANLLGLGRNKMLAKLREFKVLTARNIPYQQHLDANRFEVKESTQNGFNIATTYVTPKGIEYIRKKLNN